MRRSERPFSHLPTPLLLSFVLFFGLQVFHHRQTLADSNVRYQALKHPYESETYRGLSMGSEQLFAALLTIKLQLHDNQAGQHFRYQLIDYSLLVQWLDRLSDLSGSAEYPMLLASRVYVATAEPNQLRQIIGFIERRFDDHPQLHWRRLVEASLVAKHKLGDLELALRLAEKIARQPASVQMPAWARDFQFLLLAELNELESAITIIQAMLVSDAVHDPDEKRFLQSKLSEFQQRLFESQQNGL